jgi:hypothetical protein
MLLIYFVPGGCRCLAACSKWAVPCRLQKGHAQAPQWGYRGTSVACWSSAAAVCCGQSAPAVSRFVAPGSPAAPCKCRRGDPVGPYFGLVPFFYLGILGFALRFFTFRSSSLAVAVAGPPAVGMDPNGSGSTCHQMRAHTAERGGSLPGSPATAKAPWDSAAHGLDLRTANGQRQCASQFQQCVAPVRLPRAHTSLPGH